MVAQQLQGTERCRAGVHQQWSQTQGELPRHFSATSMHTVLSPVGGGGIGNTGAKPVPAGSAAAESSCKSAELSALALAVVACSKWRG